MLFWCNTSVPLPIPKFFQVGAAQFSDGKRSPKARTGPLSCHLCPYRPTYQVAVSQGGWYAMCMPHTLVHQFSSGLCLPGFHCSAPTQFYVPGPFALPSHSVLGPLTEPCPKPSAQPVPFAVPCRCVAWLSCVQRMLCFLSLWISPCQVVSDPAPCRF